MAYVDIKRGAIDRSLMLPIPYYLFDVQQALYMSLVCALIVMRLETAKNPLEIKAERLKRAPKPIENALKPLKSNQKPCKTK